MQLMLGRRPLFSAAWRWMPAPMDFMLEAHFERWLDSIAPPTAGTAKAASTAMMAMTTSSSIKVKAL